MQNIYPKKNKRLTITNSQGQRIVGILAERKFHNMNTGNAANEKKSLIIICHGLFGKFCFKNFNILYTYINILIDLHIYIIYIYIHIYVIYFFFFFFLIKIFLL